MSARSLCVKMALHVSIPKEVFTANVRVGTVESIAIKVGCYVNISNTKERVSPHFQTPRRESEIRHAAEYF